MQPDSTQARLSAGALVLIGALYAIDGASLLLRGIVGGLFMLHENASVLQRVTLLLHFIGGGLAYGFFGISLATKRNWVFRPLGYIIAASCLLWALPTLGGDFFTAGQGLAFLLLATLGRARGDR